MSRSIKRLKSEEFTEKTNEEVHSSNEDSSIIYSRNLGEFAGDGILARYDVVDSPMTTACGDAGAASRPKGTAETLGVASDKSNGVVNMNCSVISRNKPFLEHDENIDPAVTVIFEELENARSLISDEHLFEAENKLKKAYSEIARCGNKFEKLQMYEEALQAFSKCNNAMYPLLCHYQVLLLSDNKENWETQRLFSAQYWLHAITAGSSNINRFHCGYQMIIPVGSRDEIRCGLLCTTCTNATTELLQTMSRIFMIATQHFEDNPHRHLVVMSVMMELLFTYRCLMSDPLHARIIKYIDSEYRKVQMKMPKLFFLSDRFSDVCLVFRNLTKSCGDLHCSESLELWARSLEKLGKVDVAIKKAKEALSILRLNYHSEDEEYRRVDKYIRELEAQRDRSLYGTDEVVHSDDEWLENTTVHDTKMSRMMREKRENEHDRSGKRTRRRPKAKQRIDVENSKPYVHEAELVNNNNNSNMKEQPQTTIKNWKDISEATDYSFLLDKGKKRKRRYTGASDVSSSSTMTAESLLDILGPNRDEEVESRIEDDESKSEEFRPRPEDLPNWDDWSMFDSMSISDVDEEYEYCYEEKTLYELSMEALENENGIKGIGIQDSQLLAHGLKLSERCKKHYCTPAKKERKFVYDAEYPREKLIALCRNQPRSFKTCKIQIESSHGAVCTNLDLSDEISKIEISGRSKCGKAYTDDIVVVEVLKDNSAKDSFIPRLNKTTQNDNTVYGQVRGILERKRFKGVDHPVFVCILDDFQNYLMKPMCKTVPKLSIHRRQCENDFQIEIYDYIEDTHELRFKEIVTLDLNSKKAYVFLVALLDWEEQYPLGVVIKMIKASENVFSNRDILRLQFQAPFLYKEETINRVNAILEEMPIEPTARFARGRKDLSDCLKVFTIDPEGSRDLDDAISVQRFDNNIFQVGVHIADVTSIVIKDDPIDIEAKERATTFYQGQGARSYHMLPEPLSNNLCSLIPGKRRLAISIFFKLGVDGKLKEKPHIEKTVVRSTNQYTYKDIQAIIEERNQTDDHVGEILTLVKLTSEMRKIRMKDKRFAFSVESELTENVESTVDTSEAHSLVEELMILTNMTIANFVTRNSSKHLANAMILRSQSEPPKDQIEKWKKNYPLVSNFVMHLQDVKVQQQYSPLSVKDESVKLRYINIMSFQKWVWQEMTQALQEQNFSKLKQLIGSDELHPEICVAYEDWIDIMEIAEYRCAGSLKNPKKDGKHFSLEICPYTHFTSPIRRYADIIAHRLVLAILDAKEPPYKQSEVETICDHLNEVTKRAKQFQRQSRVLSWGLKLKDKPIVVHGMVKRVSDKEVTLHIPGMRGLPKSCKELELNLLNVCSKPQFTKERYTEKDILTLHWQRRIYSSTGFYHKPRNQRLKKLECQRIDPHQRSVYQQLLKWQNITKEIVSERHPKHLSKAFKNIDTPDVDMIGNVPACHNTELDVSSEVPKGNNIVHQKCNFSMSFNHAQVIAIQLHAEPERGIFVPSIQLLDMTRNVKCCLQHMQNPVKVFTRNSTTSTKSAYVSSIDYIRTWLPLITMEAATKAVENDPAVINDLHVVFEQNGGIFSLRKSFCEKRDISMWTGFLESILMGKTKDDDSEEDDSIEYVTSPDYLCIRCEITKHGNLLTERRVDQAPSQKLFWIGHARVDKIKNVRKKGKVNIHFELTKTSPKPYPSMFEPTEGVQCCVEIIQKTDDDRRTETVLKFLEKASPLAKGIALGQGKRLPKLNTRHIEEAKKLGDRLDIKGLPSNNNDQKEALKNSLCKSFSLIQGPPGTGKTRTAVNLLMLFCHINRSILENGGERKQIIFCGPSNKSVDVAAKKMLQTLGESAPKCVRMYGSSLENIDYPIPGKVFATRHSQADTRPDPDLRSIWLHDLIRKDGKPYAEKIRACDKAFENFDNAECIDFYKIKEYGRILRKASEEELKEHEIIFCTTAVATSPRLLLPCRGKIFQLVMDEAGMCTEPQSISAIIATVAQQVVFIGDHKQLRPVVKSSQSKNLGLEKSLFERYSQRASFLSSQYRMNPKICDFPSKQFYSGKLMTVRSRSWEVVEPLKMWLDPQIPLVFCHVEGIEECLTVSTEEGNQQSRSNKAEIDQVVKVVEHMIKQEAVQPNDINVMSQYNSQCHSIRDSLKKRGISVRENKEEKSIRDINVNTVVASQGGEWDYVVFSTVRSLPHYRIEPNPTLGWCQQNLGFITDEHQINVALTRARKGLIIIGNKNLLRCEPKVWKQLIQFYERNHCLVDAHLFPRGPIKQHQKARDLSHQTSEEFQAGLDVDMD